MSRNDFVIVGKMGMNKGTDKFKPFEVTENKFLCQKWFKLSKFNSKRWIFW